MKDSLNATTQLVLKLFGNARVLSVGINSEKLFISLSMLGAQGSWIDVDQWSDYLNENGSDRPFFTDKVKYEVLVLDVSVEDISVEQGKKLLRKLFQAPVRFYLLKIKLSDKKSEINRHWFEEVCFGLGVRKHSKYYLANPYDALNDDSGYIFLPLEKIPELAAEKYTLEELSKHRILHMDMLREVGRRGDAHCIRYVMASEYVRPGDTVLDTACGLGYGSHILYHNSQANKVLGVDLSQEGIDYAKSNYSSAGIDFNYGDAQNLSFIEDNSIDFIASFETIEHLPDPLAYLRELNRVLKPAGRIMICAPNDWTDETGNDPNPHHLHVYTWDRLREEFRGQFILEKAFSQVAGGAMKCHFSPRSWKNVDAYENPEFESEWIIFLGMKNPMLGSGVKYIENTWAIPSNLKFNVSAFERDYDNPWLVKGIVARGMRLSNEKALFELQKQVLNVSTDKSIDYGASLCGVAYAYIEGKQEGAFDLETMLECIESYCSNDNTNPHFTRWKVSLLYVAGDLCRTHGDLEKAYRYYSQCAEIDVLVYSPLLGNKILDALYWISILELGKGNFEAAKEVLKKSLYECKRLSSADWLNVIGEIDNPLTFGLSEMSELFDKGSRNAYALSILINSPGREPLLFSDLGMGYFQRRLVYEREKIESLKNEVDLLRESIKTTFYLDPNLQAVNESSFRSKLLKRCSSSIFNALRRFRK